LKRYIFHEKFQGSERCKFYGISKDPISLNYVLVFDYKNYNQNLCVKCQSSSVFYYWCKSCKLSHFQLNYGESPSGNNEIDEILKDYYCESRLPKDLIEWIPYNEFKNIEYITYEGYSKFYSAIWLNGYISHWNKNNLNWGREIKNLKVTLINFEDLDLDLLNHMYHMYKVRFFLK
jgi:hypothetical protein